MSGPQPSSSRRSVRQRRQRRAQGERGFSIIEQLIAISLMVGVLLTLLGALGSGAAGVAAGRQRTLATSLAKQSVEQLQGAGYTTVLMDLSSATLATDTRVTGTAPNYLFEAEPLAGGGTQPHQTTTTNAGTTFTISTYITSLTPATAMAHRRITVIVEWTPSTTGNFRSERFSSLLYPLDYASYPAGSGSAEVNGGLATVTGTLGSDTFEDVQFTLPSARASTNASTLRTAQGTAASQTATVDVASGPLTSTQCTVSPSRSARCPLNLLDRFGDNDVATTAATFLGGNASLYSAATVTTLGGAVFTTPAGSANSHASVDTCASCGFGDGDGVPWADGSSATSGAATATFAAGGAGGLVGSLWNAASGWSVSAEVDHDTSNSGMATPQASLTAPEVKILAIPAASGFGDGAVLVPGFTARATAPVGGNSNTAAASGAAVSVKMREGTGYRTELFTPGTAKDVTTSGTVVVGANTVTMTSRVQSQAKTLTSTGTAPRTAAVAQLPSVLIVTVEATISGANPGQFTTTFDYGLITARGAWQVAP